MDGKLTAIVIVLCSALFFTAGILIGTFAINSTSNDEPSTPEAIDAISLLIDEIKADKISSNLRHLTSVPHVAGTQYDSIQAEWIRDQFIASGLDEAKTVPYEVLLSYPKPGTVNTISLLDDQGNAKFTTVGRQPVLQAPEEASTEVQPNYNAYSPPGIVEGNVVYGYYGRDEDYDYLLSQGIDVSGKIVLLRYGAMFRGSKVAIAQKRGAKGVILFSDPQDKAVEGRNNTYPSSWWLPGMGTESGTLFNGDGDPLTPLYPSLESAYRINVEDQKGIPKIPAQPIGYDEAEVILQSLSTKNPPPPNWVGHLNASYSLGPEPLNSGWKVRMNITTSHEKRTIYNTIGILKGSEEDDRYVVLGNHRDAWTFGALDPSSGTASLVEIARAFGKIKLEQGWRPRRTIVFCSWGAEEFGLIGSYEWTEQHSKVLSQRAIAYINVDVAVGGNMSFTGSAFPTLRDVLYESAKLVPSPGSSIPLFNSWLTAQNPNAGSQDKPEVGILGGGSDFQAFTYVIGVPAIDMGYTASYGYPTYHTLYDTFYLASELVDKGFIHHQAVARMWAVTATKLADSVLLPFNIQYYTDFIEESLSHLEEKYNATLEKNGATFKYFRQSVEYFSSSAQIFKDTTLTKVDLTNTMAVRKVNDKLMNLERFFVDPRGLPDRPETNHIVFSLSASNLYSSETFAGLEDLLSHVGDLTEEEDPVTWGKIKQHLAVIAFMIGEAARSLNENF